MTNLPTILVTLDGATQVLGTPPASYGISDPLTPEAVSKLREALRLRGFDDEVVRRAVFSVGPEP